jgi:hypothetical protein
LEAVPLVVMAVVTEVAEVVQGIIMTPMVLPQVEELIRVEMEVDPHPLILETRATLEAVPLVVMGVAKVQEEKNPAEVQKMILETQVVSEAVPSVVMDAVKVREGKILVVVETRAALEAVPLVVMDAVKAQEEKSPMGETKPLMSEEVETKILPLLHLFLISLYVHSVELLLLSKKVNLPHFHGHQTMLIVAL